MKRFIRVLSVLLALSLLYAYPAYAVGDWETHEVILDSGDKETPDSTWETEPIDIDFDNKTDPETPAKKISISKCSVSNIKSKTYSGKKKTQSPTVKYGKKTLKKGTDYTLSYKNNTKVGTATVTIKGAGGYSGSVKKTFKINPKGTSVSKLSKPKSKQIKVTWKTQKTQTSGYQIQYALNSSFTKSKKTVTVSNNKTKAKTIKSLKKNKKYFVRIRTYKKVDGKKYYSSWSKAKSIKTK